MYNNPLFLCFDTDDSKKTEYKGTNAVTSLYILQQKVCCLMTQCFYYILCTPEDAMLITASRADVQMHTSN